MRRVIEVPNWKIKLFETPGLLDKLLAGQAPGVVWIVVDHEEGCAGHDRCDCDPGFHVEREDATAD